MLLAKKQLSSNFRKWLEKEVCESSVQNGYSLVSQSSELIGEYGFAVFLCGATVWITCGWSQVLSCLERNNEGPLYLLALQYAANIGSTFNVAVFGLPFFSLKSWNLWTILEKAILSTNQKTWQYVWFCVYIIILSSLVPQRLLINIYHVYFFLLVLSL